VSLVVAVDYGCGDDVEIVWICPADGYWLSVEADLAIAWAGVCAGFDFDYIPVGCVVYGVLDVVEVCGGVVIYGYYSRVGC